MKTAILILTCIDIIAVIVFAIFIIIEMNDDHQDPYGT